MNLALFDLDHTLLPIDSDYEWGRFLTRLGVVDGARQDWKKGDLILLPLKQGGVEHQHFNTDPNKPARWLALIYAPFQDSMAHFLDQKEESPLHRSAS